ncbi:Fe-S cluster assembly protein SufD [Oscillatoria salina]|uniref:Fe-S cluster assembly protein SufD n=1 Tax=Oscillatoria salina TaxID=331517 RepID=UPI0013BD71CD|nr:Fe-S cluster assembly protein SufD [Oscillatoria salina]MBZ8183211.1 Fe-S cluster assembly protein SufD [Oscillatoria salina IIICB1]NET88542.1 Fe-S cluster assembly protein SufD [Kamptonema sp. SIO1D9]
MSTPVPSTSSPISLPQEELKADSYLSDLLRQCEAARVVFRTEITGWLQELRQIAAYGVAQQKLPQKKDEDWRFTDLSELLAIQFQAAGKVSVDPEAIAGLQLPEAAQSRLVFVNGFYAPELSDVSGLPTGVFVGNLADLPTKQSYEIVKYLGQQEGAKEVFTALNTAGLGDVAIVWAGENVVVEKPLHLLFLTAVEKDPILTQPRTLVVAEKSSSLQIVEHYAAIPTPGCTDFPQNRPYFTNAVTEIWLEENAEVNHTRNQRESGDGFQIGKTAIAQARASRYTCNEINLGAKLSRHNLEVYQTGEQTETRLNGLTMVDGEQLSDTHSAIALTKPFGSTDQLHKCILGDRSRAVFNGKVFVPREAQQTNAAQLNRNLLLSNKARVDTKPELQITADNVKCSHGATVSQLEPEEVFYLRSRGLNEADARHLLIDAFAAEILERIPVESLRYRLSQCVACRTD